MKNPVFIESNDSSVLLDMKWISPIYLTNHLPENHSNATCVEQVPIRVKEILFDNGNVGEQITHIFFWQAEKLYISADYICTGQKRFSFFVFFAPALAWEKKERLEHTDWILDS